MIEVFFNDLTFAKQQELRQKGFYHDNIDINPLFILEQDDDINDNNVIEEFDDNDEQIVIKADIDSSKMKLYYKDVEHGTELFEYIYFFDKNFENKVKESIDSLKTQIKNYKKARKIINN